MATNHDEIFALEKDFWTGGEKFFKAHTDGDCLVAFPEMVGVMSNADLAETARKPNRWKDLEIELKGHRRAVRRDRASQLRSACRP